MPTLTGYAATFHAVDAQADAIRPGAFARTLVERAGRVPLCWQHDITEPIGRITALREDAHGLWFAADLAATRRAADALALIERGALRECSIGFLPRRLAADPPRGPHATRVRVITALDLIEISLVTLAANPGARVLTLNGAPLARAPASPLRLHRQRIDALAPLPV